MPNIQHIEVLFGTKSRIAVLRVLRETKTLLSVSEISRRAGITRPAADDALKDFERLEVVSCLRTAGAKLYSLREDNYYTRELIIPLFNAESDVREEIIKDLRDSYGDFTVSTVLFGSYARGDYSSESDVDVVLIASDNERKEQLEDLSADYALFFFQKFGSSCLPLIYTEDEVSELLSTSPGLAENIYNEGVVVSGTMPEFRTT